MPLNGERELLQCLQTGPVSGDVLAQAAGLTRAAIWKRIQALRAAGIDIQAQAGQGYTLAQPLDWLDAKVIGLGLPAPLQALLAGLDVAWSLDSTNSELLRRVTPARGTTVLLAERQTGGRGRRGREWSSPLAAHLYLSLARHFHGGLARLGGLSLVAGIAVAEGLQGLGFDGVRLKWPNDLVVASGDGLAKLGGILVESGGSERVSGTADPVRAVIGIGVNVRMPAVFAEAIGQPWLDLQQMAGGMPARNAVATALLERLLPALALFDDAGLEPFLPRYAALDALSGRAIDVHAHDGVHPAHALGIAGDGALRVRMAGNERHVHAGEVSVRAVE